MVKLNQTEPGFQQSQFTEQSASQATLNNQPNQKGLFQIPEKFLQLIPWIPVGLEMLTGQKIPPTGVLADILSGVQQLQFSLSQVLNQQSQLLARLNSLENNASSQLNSLSQQVANTNSNFKLLAIEKQSFVGDQTKRSLEFNPPSELERHENEYN